VANKTVNDAQCTIIWHVDDIKVPHVNPNVVTQVLKILDDEYGEISALVVTRGKLHDYLGMTLDFSDGKVKIDMEVYVKTMLVDLPPDMEGEVIAPAAQHLFDISEEATKLREEQAQVYHFYTAKLLFLCKRARPDIWTPTAFLTTSLQSPDEDDWKKLGRVM
jgi:hypothetical protein